MYNCQYTQLTWQENTNIYSGFKDMYLYILHNKLPDSVPTQRRVKADAIYYVLINELLFFVNKISYWLYQKKLEPIIFHKYSTTSYSHYTKDFAWNEKNTSYTACWQNMNVSESMWHMPKKQGSRFTQFKQDFSILTEYLLIIPKWKALTVDINFIPKWDDDSKYLLVASCENYQRLCWLCQSESRAAEVVAQSS